MRAAGGKGFLLPLSGGDLLDCRENECVRDNQGKHTHQACETSDAEDHQLIDEGVCAGQSQKGVDVTKEMWDLLLCTEG